MPLHQGTQQRGHAQPHEDRGAIGEPVPEARVAVDEGYPLAELDRGPERRQPSASSTVSVRKAAMWFALSHVESAGASRAGITAAA